MHQQVPSPDTDRHREHDVLKLLRGDRARVGDWDMDIGCFRSEVNNSFPAERNDGSDALRIGTRQLLCIFEATEIEPLPDLRHGNNCYTQSVAPKSPRGFLSDLCESSASSAIQAFYPRDLGRPYLRITNRNNTPAVLASVAN